MLTAAKLTIIPDPAEALAEKAQSVLIKLAITMTADEAWGIAFRADCEPDVCLAIEALSDDPDTCANLAALIASRYERS